MYASGKSNVSNSPSHQTNKSLNPFVLRAVDLRTCWLAHPLLRTYSRPSLPYPLRCTLVPILRIVHPDAQFPSSTSTVWRIRPYRLKVRVRIRRAELNVSWLCLCISSVAHESDILDATPDIDQYRIAWAYRNGCGPTNSTAPNGVKIGVNVDVSEPHANTTEKVSVCSAQNNHAVVAGFTVKGLGHSWPSTAGLDGGVTDFNATTADILPFFDQRVMD